jgi:hypothetical protein
MFHRSALSLAAALAVVLGWANVSEACWWFHHCGRCYHGGAYSSNYPTGYSNYPTNNAPGLGTALTIEQLAELLRRAAGGGAVGPSVVSPNVQGIADDVAALKIRVSKNETDIQEAVKSQQEIANAQDKRIAALQPGGAGGSNKEVLDAIASLKTELTKEIIDRNLALETRLKKEFVHKEPKSLLDLTKELFELRKSEKTLSDKIAADPSKATAQDATDLRDLQVKIEAKRKEIDELPK